MAFLQQFGTITISTSSLVDIQSSAGVPVGMRVFDFAYAKTTGTIGSAILCNVTASGVTSTPILTLTNTELYKHSAVGWRFPNGAYCVLAGGATVSLNYMLEVT
jgi:hypothetical protein